MKRLPCFMHGAGLDCSSYKTANHWHVSIILFTVRFGHSVFMLDGVRCFPHTYRAILGKLGGQFMDRRQRLSELPQLYHRLHQSQRAAGRCAAWLRCTPVGSWLFAVEDWDCSAALCQARSCCQAEVVALASKLCSNTFWAVCDSVPSFSHC